MHAVYKHAYLNILLFLHSAYMLCMVKMSLKGDFGGCALSTGQLAMTNLFISNTQHMSKLSSIPKHFPYIALYFKPVYVELGYHEISAMSKWFFIPEN